MYDSRIIISAFIILCSCQNPSSSDLENKSKNPGLTQIAVKNNSFNKTGATISERFKPPAGYERVTQAPLSFASYLRSLPLKHPGAQVKLYNGELKYNQNVHAAVVDLPIGHKNLHQCADGIMRLRAEYLFSQNLFDDIHFNFTNGFRADYTMWINGYRVAVKENKCTWEKSQPPSNHYSDLWNYLETIFTYAGTLSLSKELLDVDIFDMKIGDIFIQGGSPGHAVIVVDVAVDKSTNNTAFILAQSYMPAQELHILKNLNNHSFSPWYILEPDVRSLYTPEWTFDMKDLKRFSKVY